MSDTLVPNQPTIVFAERCDRGKKREENQDSVLRSGIRLGVLMLVADGVGGYTGGAIASRMVIDGLHTYLKALPENYPPDLAIREAVAQSNASIFAAANERNSLTPHMGSTVVLALIRQKARCIDAWIGHIGDSRAYLARDGQLRLLTRDHSAVQALLDRNLITPEEAFHHPDASVLTRSLGHWQEVEIDLQKFSLQEGDSLLLCTDGLWGYVPGESIHRVVADPGLTAAAAADGLLKLALDAGGHDNVGIELARINVPDSDTDIEP